jgi:aryl-alcohol dehydrogenase-like predicted oxidoreductase
MIIAACLGGVNLNRTSSSSNSMAVRAFAAVVNFLDMAPIYPRTAPPTSTSLRAFCM